MGRTGPLFRWKAVLLKSRMDSMDLPASNVRERAAKASASVTSRLSLPCALWALRSNGPRAVGKRQALDPPRWRVGSAGMWAALDPRLRSVVLPVRSRRLFDVARDVMSVALLPARDTDGVAPLLVTRGVGAVGATRGDGSGDRCGAGDVERNRGPANISVALVSRLNMCGVMLIDRALARREGGTASDSDPDPPPTSPPPPAIIFLAFVPDCADCGFLATGFRTERSASKSKELSFSNIVLPFVRTVGSTVDFSKEAPSADPTIAFKLPSLFRCRSSSLLFRP